MYPQYKNTHARERSVLACLIEVHTLTLIVCPPPSNYNIIYDYYYINWVVRARTEPNDM